MPPRRIPKQPPPGNIRALLTQGPRVETPEAQDPQTSTNMALTKSDLVETLAGFKSELRNELKADLLAEFQSFKSELNDKLAGLRSDVDSVGSRVLDAEVNMQGLEERTSQQAEDLQALKDQMEFTLLKTED